MKKYSLLILSLSMAGLLTTRTGWCSGISNDTSAVLKIGDKVPDSVIHHIVNYSTDELKLTDFNNKLLILDFWATYCSPCLRSLPKFQELQTKFSGKAQILLVTSDKTQVVLRSLSAHHVSLPSITQSSLFRSFNVNYIPHEVWIKNGVIIAETQPWVVNESNLEKVISGTPVSLPSKTTPYKFDDNKAFLVNGNGGEGNNLLFHSVLTGYTDGYPSRRIHGHDQNRSVNRVTIINGGISVLYQTAYELLNPELAYDNRLVINVRDSLKPYFFRPENTDQLEQMASYGFCYEIIAEPHDLPAKMISDMNGYFGRSIGIRAEIQKRTARCWAITKLPGREIVPTAGGEISHKLDSTGYFLANVAFRQFLTELLTVRRNSLPVVDRSGFRGNIDLRVLGKFDDLSALKRALNEIGLDINEMNSLIDMLVITDKIDNNLNDKPKP